MRLGLGLPLGGRGEALAADARAVERAGFDSVWFFDTINRGNMGLDPLMAAAVAATATERIEVGIGILQVPLRHPVELAQRVLSAQLLSGGRLLLGVGSGSTKLDFDAVGLEYNDRLRRLNDGLRVMRRLWAGEVLEGANLTPLPSVLGGPPVLIGSWGGERWVARAAQEFDGWIASAGHNSYDGLADAIGRYRAAGGKRAVVTTISTDLNGEPDAYDEASAPFHLRSTPEVAAERLTKLAALGFDDAVLVHRGPEPDLAALRSLVSR
jgi:alkanesulfonate monooxygenase SsuD/methylene tetrahydromethanopterin reductase-like flavin-dependent oxidoreductase (luciferase family)